MRELEAHFLEVDVLELEDKLEALGGIKDSDVVVKDRIYENPAWKTGQKRIRIRQDGKRTELTYKEQVESNVLGGTEEIQTVVSDPDKMHAILVKLGVCLKRFVEKRRIRYYLDGVTFDIESWPKLPPYLEIEGPNEEMVKTAAERLGLEWEKACYLDAKEIYEQVYKIGPIGPIKYLTFDRFE